MGSQTQTALPKAPVPDRDPARSETENVKKKSRPARRRKRVLVPPEPHVRPAFLLESARGDNDDAVADNVRGEGEIADTRKTAPRCQSTLDKRIQDADTNGKILARTASVEIHSVDAKDGDTGAGSNTPVPETAGTGGSPEAGEITDPDLIVLLEQLSETIDTANQVLSETPPAAGAAQGIQDEHAAASEPPVPERPAPPPVPELIRQRSATGLTTITVAGIAVLLAAAGSFLWFRGNPWLLDGVPTREMTAATSGEAGQGAINLNRPVPAVPVPLPPRKPQPGEMVARTASLGPETVIPDLPAAPSVARPRSSQTVITPAATAAPGTGPAGGAIDLGLPIPVHSQNQEISVMIQGVPEEARLSAGKKIGGGTWVLEEKDLIQLALVTPPSFRPRAFTLDMVTVKSDGKIPESRSIEVVVQPAQAATAPAPGNAGTVTSAKTPAAVTAVARPVAAPVRESTSPAAETLQKSQRLPRRQLSAEEETRFLKRGEELLQLGDVASARLVLEHAARRDSRRAMTALAKTYDPEYLAKLGVRGVKPDKNQANAWYERASRKADR